jgi:hypothetical protein
MRNHKFKKLLQAKDLVCCYNLRARQKFNGIFLRVIAFHSFNSPNEAKLNQYLPPVLELGRSASFASTSWRAGH